MKHVFISYSSKDGICANKIVNLLGSNGIETWIAPDNIPAGSTYTESIVKAIKESGAVVLIVSANSLNSTWVHNEIERAINYKKRIFPIQIDNAPLNEQFELMISSAQIINYDALLTNPSYVNSFLTEVKKTVYNISDGSYVHMPPPKPKRFKGITIAVIVGLIVYGIAYGIGKSAVESAAETTTHYTSYTTNAYEERIPYVGNYIISFPISYSKAQEYFGIGDYTESGVTGDNTSYYWYQTRFGYQIAFLVNGTPPQTQTDFQFSGVFIDSSNAKICNVSPGMKLYEVKTELGYKYTEAPANSSEKYLIYHFNNLRVPYTVQVNYDDSETVIGIFYYQ